MARSWEPSEWKALGFGEKQLQSHRWRAICVLWIPMAGVVLAFALSRFL